MVRKCIVSGCPHTDLSILSHRFPRRTENVLLWMEALGILNIPVSDLIGKYVVCTEHFKKSDYRNAVSNSLNFTACPSLKNTASLANSTEETVVTQTLGTSTPPIDIVTQPSNTSSKMPVSSPKISLKRIPNPIVIKKHHVSNPETMTITLESEPHINVIDISGFEELDDNAVSKMDDIEIVEEIFAGEQEEIVIVDDPLTNRSITNGLFKCQTQQTPKSLPSHVLRLYPSSSIKRKRSATPPKSKLKTITDSSIQTDADESEEIEKNYSDFKDLSKLDLIKQLKEKDRKIIELEAKTEKLKQIIQNW